MHFRTAQRIAVDDLADRRLDDLRAAEMHAAVACGHHHFVRQRRNIGAACGAFAEHGGDLRNAGGRHPALPVERAAEMILVGEHFVALLPDWRRRNRPDRRPEACSRSAMSWARTCLRMVSLKNEPPFVVASLAMIMQITPRMVPIPVTRPAPGTALS